jgi:tetratricopeptide (TPR) repeat protein
MYRTAYFFYCLGKHFDSKILLKIFKHLFSGDVKFLMRRALYFAIAGIRLGLRERSDMNEDDVNKFFKSLDEIGIDTTRIIKVLKSKKELEKVEDFSDREKEHFEMLADDLMGSKYKNVFEEAKEVAELSYYFYNMLKQKEEFTKRELSIFIEPGFVNHLFQLVTNHPTLGIIQDYIDSLENANKRLKEYEKYINKYPYNFDLYMRYIEELIKSRNRNKIPKVLEKGYKKLTEVLPEELTPIHVEDENMGMYVLLLLNWYSGVLVEENQLSKAQKALELSQRLDPEDIFSTKDQQMKIYLEKGNFEDLKKVLKFSHLENVSEAMNAALLYYHTGEYDYAEKIVFDALDNNPFILDILLYEDPREAVRALQDKREFDDDIVSEAVDYSFKFRKHWVIEKALKWLKNIKDVFDEIR